MGDLIGAGGNISYDAFTEIRQLVSTHLLALPQPGCLTILELTCWVCGDSVNLGAEKSLGPPNW